MNITLLDVCELFFFSARLDALWSEKIRGHKIDLFQSLMCVFIYFSSSSSSFFCHSQPNFGWRTKSRPNQCTSMTHPKWGQKNRNMDDRTDEWNVEHSSSKPFLANGFFGEIGSSVYRTIALCPKWFTIGAHNLSNSNWWNIIVKSIGDLDGLLEYTTINDAEENRISKTETQSDFSKQTPVSQPSGNCNGMNNWPTLRGGEKRNNTNNNKKMKENI